jgi:hypothetical protein
MGWAGVDWIHLAPGLGPVACPVEHDNEPSDSIKCWEFPEFIEKDLVLWR